MKRKIQASIGIIFMTISLSVSATLGLGSAKPFLAVEGLLLMRGAVYIADTSYRTRFETIGALSFLPLLLTGLILLEEDNVSSVEFVEIEHSALLEMGLTEQEAIAYNNNTEELSLIFQDIQFTSGSAQEAKNRWEEQAELIGEAAVDGARKVIRLNFDY